MLLFSSFSFCFFQAHSQTTNISGIVNSYYHVVDIIPAKAAIKVANVTGLNMDDKVMIIQMKGASVNTANNSSFGDTTSLNNAGNYEIGTICDINIDTIFLLFNLVNQYTVSEKVQLVKFAEYYSANVTDTVKAASWNNASGTGGVIAISVTEDLILNAPIFADSIGYKGGAAILSGGGFCALATGYTYNPNVVSPTTQNGATKGEGVADIASNINGGRGAPANGGGGGNYHNNGGGGGANLVAGGNGGGTSSYVGCTGDYRGIGGKPLNSRNGIKIFAGGGGGAGHYNNNIPTHGGGNGGGIIFITANNLVGNGYKIRANGQTGGSNVSDGASGGGAGGTIIMDILNSYTGSVTIQANGGNGGNANDGLSTGRCYGAGGGGSAGVIYFTGTPPAVTINTNAGSAGLEISSDPLCSVVLPTAGSTGSVISNYSYTRSMSPASYCSTILPIHLLHFKALANQNKVLLQWKIANPELVKNFIIERSDQSNEWERISYVAAIDLTEKYQFIDNNPLSGINQYHLKVIEKNSNEYFSNVQKILIDRNNKFEVYPNPATSEINVSGNFSSLTTLTINDPAGKLILQRNLMSRNKTIKLDLPPLLSGVYTIRINDTVKKLLIR